MSREEFAWHRWQLSNRLRLSKAERVETLLRDEMQGLRVLDENGKFNECSSDGSAGGILVFRESTGRRDLEWIRQICQSVRISGKCFPEVASKEQLGLLFTIVEKNGASR